MPVLYDLSRLAPVPEDMTEAESWAVAEKLRGTIKTHVAYAVPATEARHPATGRNRALVPHLTGVEARALSQAVAQGKSPKLDFAGMAGRLSLPRAAAPLIARVDGRRSLAEIASDTGTDPIGMGALWGPVEAEMTGWGLLRYSTLLR